MLANDGEMNFPIDVIAYIFWQLLYEILICDTPIKNIHLEAAPHHLQIGVEM